MLKKYTFFNAVFSRCFMVLASENDSKIKVFSDFFRKRRFCKNCAPVQAGVKFSLSPGVPKIDQKSFQNGAKTVTILVQNLLKRDLQKKIENSTPK